MTCADTSDRSIRSPRVSGVWGESATGGAGGPRTVVAMSKHDVPRNAKGERICQFCHDPEPLPPSLGTKPRIYCSASCKQQAYAARKTEKAILAAVENAERRAAARTRKSMTMESKVNDFADGSQQVSEPTSLTLPLPGLGDIPAPAAEPDPAVLPDPPAAAPLPAPVQRRRRVGMTASAMPLPEPEPVAVPMWEDSEIEGRLARYGIGAHGEDLPTRGE